MTKSAQLGNSSVGEITQLVKVQKGMLSTYAQGFTVGGGQGRLWRIRKSEVLWMITTDRMYSFQIRTPL
jgi:hypothetical protein